MDKKSILAVVLITIIIILLPSYYDLIIDKSQEQNNGIEETNVIENKTEKKESTQQKETTLNNERKIDLYDSLSKPIKFENNIVENIILVETPLITAKISNRGGGNVLYWSLKEYGAWSSESAKIIDENLKNGFKFNFISIDGVSINLNDYNFTNGSEIESNLILNANDSITLDYYLNIFGSQIKKSITIFGEKYHINVTVSIDNSEKLFLNNEYQIGWINGLPSNEKNEEEDYTYSDAYASMGGEIEEFNIDSEGKVEPVLYIGETEWIAIRTKYFLAAIIPKDMKAEYVNFSGYGYKSGEVVERRYAADMNISKKDIANMNQNNKNINVSDSFTIYMGPMDHSILSDYQLNLDYLILNHGWYEETFRPVTLFILWVFKIFKLFIPNYGVVIILFSIIVKILVYPLTKKSYKSMKEMSKVQPLITELREKYKGDPQRLNKETMKLYKEHKINPLGGCLPTLLQLPLLGALFILFRSTIQLRGASFIPGWIDDLSRSDTLATLPFSLPLYGNQFNLLPILMAGTMIIQSKMTMKDPKQKAMVYMMPIFMLLLFNQFPSGLNLYYTLFNILTIIQQKLIDGTGKTKTPEPEPIASKKKQNKKR